MNTPKEGGGEHTETDTHHTAQAGSAQAGTWWREGRGPGRQPRGSWHWERTRRDRTGLGRNHTVQGAWHLTETRPRPADTGPGAQEESRCQGGLRAPARNGPSSDPFCLQHVGWDQCGPTSPVVRFTCLQGLRSTGLRHCGPTNPVLGSGPGKVHR